MHAIFARPPLESFAVDIGSSFWLGSQAISEEDRWSISWSGSGPFGVTIHAVKNGFIIFDFSKSEKFSGGDVPYIPTTNPRIPAPMERAQKIRQDITYARFQYMNATIFSIFSSVLEIQKAGGFLPQPTGPLNYLKAINSDMGWQFAFNKIPASDVPEAATAISIESLSAAMALSHRCYEILGNGYQEILSLTYLACHQYSAHQFSSAHLIAWCVSESMLHILWENYQNKATHTTFNRERRDTLNGRDYSASSITQILSLAQIIDDELLGKLDKARKIRNAFAHSLAAINDDNASLAISTAAEMISKVVEMPVCPQLSYGAYD